MSFLRFSNVRRGSRQQGSFENRFWRAMHPMLERRIVSAAKAYERHTRQAGARSGALGTIALEALELLVKLCDPRTGRLEPSLDYLCRALKRSRDAVCRALANLRVHGFLTWERRYTEAETAGQRGPQIRQASNAYRLELPEAARKLLGIWGMDIPMPDDAADAWDERAREQAHYQATETPEAAAGQCEDTGLRTALERLVRSARVRQAISNEGDGFYYRAT